MCTWTECNRLPIYVHGGYRGNSLVAYYIENTQYKPKKNIVESHFIGFEGILFLYSLSYYSYTHCHINKDTFTNILRTLHMNIHTTN